MNNHIILKGNVTQPPYFDHVGDTGRPFLRLYLAVDRPRNPRTGAEQPPDFFRVVAYDDQALFTYPYLRSNSGLLIIGRLRARKRRLRGGKHQTVVEVIADDITFLSKIDWEAGDAARERILRQRPSASLGTGSGQALRQRPSASLGTSSGQALAERAGQEEKV